MNEKINLMDFTYEELEAWLITQGLPKFRAKQVYDWVQKGVESVDDMTNLSKDLRKQLGEQAHTGYLKVREKLVSKLDGTIKYLMQLQDGNIVECVLMEYKHGTTICISTQVGCKMGCTFCASAILGFRRNLTAGEMLGEIITASKDSGRVISNVVLMGIGEPLDNYENVMKFLKMANDPRGLNIGGRHFSLSTSGIVSGVTMVLVPSISTFYISQKLGGGTFELIGDTIERQFVTGALNVGAAISLVMMILILISLSVMNKFTDSDEGGIII